MVLNVRSKTLTCQESGSPTRKGRQDIAPTKGRPSNVPIAEVAGAVKELIQAGKVKHFGLFEADR